MGAPSPAPVIRPSPKPKKKKAKDEVREQDIREGLSGARKRASEAERRKSRRKLRIPLGAGGVLLNAFRGSGLQV